jgi:hypothetical protein
MNRLVYAHFFSFRAAGNYKFNGSFSFWSLWQADNFLMTIWVLYRGIYIQVAENFTGLITFYLVAQGVEATDDFGWITYVQLIFTPWSNVWIKFCLTQPDLLLLFGGGGHGLHLLMPRLWKGTQLSAILNIWQNTLQNLICMIVVYMLGLKAVSIILNRQHTASLVLLCIFLTFKV